MNYAELTPIELRLKGYDIVTLRLADFGVQAYSLNLIVHEPSLAKEADVIRAIVDASIAGYEFLRQHPDEAAALFSRLFPERDPQFVRESIRMVATLLGPGPVGRQTRRGWQETITTLKTLGLLDRDVTVDEVAVARYLAE